MLKKSLFIVIIFTVFLSNVIYADDTSNELHKTIEASSTITNSPSLNARHAIVLDRNSKTTLYGKKEHEICKMASTTKIMTAIIVIENADLKDTVTISSKAARTGGSRLGLSTDDTITVENLLYGLMMRSRK